MQAPFGVWPALQYLSGSRSSQSPTDRPGHWYIDPVAGSDIGTFRGSRAQPLRTFDGLRRRLQSQWTQAPQLVSLKNDVTGYPYVTQRPTLGGGQVIIYADEAWDSTVFNIRLATTADVATSGSSIVGTFVADEHRGRSIRFTSGAAAGQVKTIRNNTTTAIIPTVAFNPAPTSGDSYEVFTNNVNLLSSGQTDIWLRIADAGLSNKGRLHAYPDSEGYVFAGVNFTTPAPTNRWLFDQGRYELYGCAMNGSIGSTLTWRMVDSLVTCGVNRVDGPTAASLVARAPFSWLGAPSATAWTGWGLAGTNTMPHGVSTGLVVGYFVTSTNADIINNYSAGLELQICGGSFRNGTGAVFNLSEVNSTLNVLNTADIPPEFIGGAVPLLIGSRGSMTLEAGSYVNTGAGPVMQALGQGWISLSSVATGQAASGDSIQALRGAKAFLTGAAAPNFGRGGVDTDYNCGNGAPVNKTFFAGLGTHMPQFTDGSTIIRVGLV